MQHKEKNNNIDTDCRNKYSLLTPENKQTIIDLIERLKADQSSSAQ